MIKLAAPLVAAVLLAGTASHASAAVTYTLDIGFPEISDASTSFRVLDFSFGGFEYTRQNGFIKTTTNVTDFTSCGVFIFSCQSIDFKPDQNAEDIAFDEVTLNLGLFPIFARLATADALDPLGPTFDFEQGAFGKVGTYTSLDGSAVLTVSSDVSAVPLPASAPLFGAAVLALGAFGFARARRSAA